MIAAAKIRCRVHNSPDHRRAETNEYDAQFETVDAVDASARPE